MDTKEHVILQESVHTSFYKATPHRICDEVFRDKAGSSSHTSRPRGGEYGIYLRRVNEKSIMNTECGDERLLKHI